MNSPVIIKITQFLASDVIPLCDSSVVYVLNSNLNFCDQVIYSARMRHQTSFYVSSKQSEISSENVKIEMQLASINAQRKYRPFYIAQSHPIIK